MRKLFISLVAIASVTAATVSYGFGLPKNPADSGNSANSAGSSVNAEAIDKFIALGAESSAQINGANELLLIALTKKEDQAKLKQQLSEMKAGLADKDSKKAQEAKEQYAKFKESSQAEISAKIASGEAEKQMKEMSEEQLKKVSKSVMLLAYGLLIQREQLPAGQNMINAIGSNPMLLKKLPAVKDAVVDMGINVKNVAVYVVKLPTILKTANVTVTLPTDTSSKPEMVDPSEF